MNRVFDGVYRRGRTIFTRNNAPGHTVYGENLVKFQGAEFRQWEPRRSKLAAAILNGLRELPIKDDSCVLYLGAASGTTVSHVADIASNGKVYAIDIAPRVIRDLIFVAERRRNIFPMLFNANLPQEYASIVEPVDIIYQDIAAPNQADILMKNAEVFLKPKARALVAIKSRSIDVRKNPRQVFAEAEAKLSTLFTVLQRIRLEPFERDHMFFHLVRK
jgi:fibrillarin-like pre-rRNA processing protein